MAFPPLYDTKEMVDFMRESFIWRWRRATRSLRPLTDNYQDLCPRFLLPKAERAALNFELPKMVQEKFYAMLLNDAIELGIVCHFLADDLKSTLVGLKWTCCEDWLNCTSRNLREAQLWQRILTAETHGLTDNEEESLGSTDPRPLPVTRTNLKLFLIFPLYHTSFLYLPTWGFSIIK